MNSFIAKSKPVVKTIEEHTADTLRLFDNFCSRYGSKFSDAEINLIRLACEVHDLGKMNSRFQNRIYKSLKYDIYIGKEYDELYKKIGVDELHHGFLSIAFIDGAFIIEKYGADYYNALVTAVYLHHVRQDDVSKKDLQQIIITDLKQQAENYVRKLNLYEMNVCDVAIKNKIEDSNFVEYDFWLKYILIKGMLNRLDYSASGNEIVDLEILPEFNGKYISDLVREKFKTLRDVQKFMESNKDKNLVVTASTGIGKTEAALLWADKDKCFYTLPLKVSINAIYKRIVGNIEDNELGYSEEKTTLLHSDALTYLFENEDNKVDVLKKNRQARLLSYPITVCTVDQLFKFVFKYLGSEIIPATLKYSKVIIDEIQMYSPDILAYILYGIKIINDLGGKFAIVTATFPPVLGYLMDKLKIPYLKSQPYYSPYTRRHYIKYFKSDLSYEYIEECSKNKKVLVLCNTVKKAQHAYVRLSSNGNNVRLLHSYYIKKDRSLLEKEIQEFTESKNTGVWISTQIVEASLDIDFDILFTEMCPADSLLQRLGRCYRKRDYSGSIPNIYIFDTGTGVGRIYDKDIYNSSVKYLAEYDDNYFKEEQKQEYINNVYSVENTKETEYYNQIREYLRKIESTVPAYFTQDQAEKMFRNIKSVTVIPDNIYNEINNNGLLDEIKEVLGNDKCSFKDRIITQNKLLAYTMQLNYGDARTQNVLDKYPIDIEGISIYRCSCKYEFDKLGRGRGLVFEETEEGNNTL